MTIETASVDRALMLPAALSWVNGVREGIEPELVPEGAAEDEEATAARIVMGIVVFTFVFVGLKITFNSRKSDT